MPAQGTCTYTEQAARGTRKVIADWTSSAAGAVSGHVTTNSYSGAIIKLVTVPSQGAMPTDNYDITLLDTASCDVLCGSGANRDSVAKEVVEEESLGAVLQSTFELRVTNAGNATMGRAVVWIS